MLLPEPAPAERKDYDYAGGDSAFERTTLEAFKEAGAEVSSLKELMVIGVYLTSAVKCGKTGYGIKVGTIKECSRLLEGGIALFANRWNLFIHQPGLGRLHLSNCCGHAALHG